MRLKPRKLVVGERVKILSMSGGVDDGNLPNEAHVLSRGGFCEITVATLADQRPESVVRRVALLGQSLRDIRRKGRGVMACLLCHISSTRDTPE